MSVIVLRNRTASGFLRWKELRPMIEPKPPPAVEGGLDDVTHALGERSEGDTLLLVDLLRRGLLEVRRGQLHLDDVGAELGGDVRGVRRDVDRGLALLGEPRAARVRP